jgi:hypothetical protein
MFGKSQIPGSGIRSYEKFFKFRIHGAETFDFLLWVGGQIIWC